MRPELLLALALLAGVPLTGCLSGGEELSPTNVQSVEADGDEAGSSDGSGDASNAARGETNESQSGAAGEDGGDEADDEDAAGSSGENRSDDRDEAEDGFVLEDSLAVVAHIDTGINPYHEIFREDSQLAYTHPSEYIDGFPEDAQALNLTLDTDSWEEAFEADQDIWENVTDDEVYWIPGTRIVGAISAGSGGTFCPPVDAAPGSYVSDPTQQGDGHRCTETPIIDDHGHGTMTASRMAGDGTSLCPDCRIVSIEGGGADQVRWAAETGWIDVQTNSWGYLVGDPAFAATEEAFDGTAREDLDAAAEEHLVYFASGNGFGGFFGFTPWPTHLQPTLREDIVWVGSHDNGKVSHWQGTPPHVVADGYRGLAAEPDSLSEVGPTAFACCTSASSPYAAGLGARIVQEARALFDDVRFGAEDGILAEGEAGEVLDGPMDDGDLSLDELRKLVKNTAEPRPSEGRHDGAAHWMSDPSPGEAASQSNPWGPAGNPYCPGCVTLPYAWTELPSQAPAYPIVGYGGATPAALTTALQVLEGLTEEPDRSEVDEYFAQQRPVRETVHDPAP